MLESLQRTHSLNQAPLSVPGMRSDQQAACTGAHLWASCSAVRWAVLRWSAAMSSSMSSRVRASACVAVAGLALSACSSSSSCSLCLALLLPVRSCSGDRGAESSCCRGLQAWCSQYPQLTCTCCLRTGVVKMWEAPTGSGRAARSPLRGDAEMFQLPSKDRVGSLSVSMLLFPQGTRPISGAMLRCSATLRPVGL